VSLARAFWIGAAGVLILAALIAVAAVARGDFGETDARILGTLFVLLLAGATAVSGLTLVERATLALLGWLAVAVAASAFVVVAVSIWSDGDAIGWEWAARSIVLLLGLLLVSTQRLLLRTASLLPLFAGTTAAAALAVLLTCSGIGADDDKGLWQVTAIFWILTGLGYLLLPVLQRFAATGGTPLGARVLAELDGVELVAVQSHNGLDIRLARGERLQLRRRS
jgi:uncharacterized membrane protein